MFSSNLAEIFLQIFRSSSITWSRFKFSHHLSCTIHLFSLSWIALIYIIIHCYPLHAVFIPMFKSHPSHRHMPGHQSQHTFSQTSPPTPFDFDFHRGDHSLQSFYTSHLYHTLYIFVYAIFCACYVFAVDSK